LRAEGAAGISLGDLITRALGHINAVLPGPKTIITVSYAAPADLIPQTGTFGYTDPSTGQITSAFGPTSQVSIKHALTVGLPRGLAHEVNHSVRIVSGPGFGVALLAQIITEGIATEFDQAAFPGRPTPGLTPSRPPRNAPCGKRHSPSSMPQAFTTLGCSAARHPALDRVHHRLPHRQRLSEPPSRYELGGADRDQRGHHPHRQRLPALPAAARVGLGAWQSSVAGCGSCWFSVPVWGGARGRVEGRRAVVAEAYPPGSAPRPCPPPRGTPCAGRGSARPARSAR
jgi:Predicted Zn-dependent protease (DUF2268)